MRALVSVFATVFYCLASYGSNPRGDDIQIGKLKAVTHEFTLPKELLLLAEIEKEKIVREGRFGLTRTNPDGITVTLEVKDDLLYITGVYISGGDGGYAVRPTMIATNIVETPVVASSFSGELYARYGRRLILHIMEYSVKIQVSEGKIVSKEDLKHNIDFDKMKNKGGFDVDKALEQFRKAQSEQP